MQVGESLPLPIIHILAQLKVFKIKIRAESINNGKMWEAKLNVEADESLNFKIKFSQITAKLQ